MELTDSPQEVIQGLRLYKNPGNKFTCALLHFTADPSGADEESRKSGMEDSRFAREHNLDFSSWAGKAVYAGFNESHVQPVWPDPNFPVLRGWDFGFHHPACVWSQSHGGFWVVGEVMGQDQTLDSFVKDVVLPYQAVLFPEGPSEWKFIDYGDIAGKQITDKSDFTSFAILSNYGIFPIGKKTAIEQGLTLIRQKIVSAELQVHPRCRILVEGFKGGYRYPEPSVAIPDPLFPMKDGFYDHLMDALRYVVVCNYDLYQKKEAPPKKQRTLVDEVMAGRNRGLVDDVFGEWF